MSDLIVLETLTILGNDGPNEVELCFGDITRLNVEDEIDVLLLSSSSDNYSSNEALPDALERKFKVSPRSLSSSKAEELPQYNCWLSTPLDLDVPFRQMLVSENPPMGRRPSPADLVKQVFDAFNLLFDADSEISAVAPLLYCGGQPGFQSTMLSAMVTSCASHMRMGCPLKRLKIVVFVEDSKDIELPVNKVLLQKFVGLRPKMLPRRGSRMASAMERRVSTCAPLPHRVLHPDEFSHSVVVMVGLPARGKTYISKKMTRYLNWVGITTRVFNVGEYRRKATTSTNHNFFDQSNAEAQLIRQQAAEDALDDLTFWLTTEGEIAVFDATNTTRQRREWIARHCRERALQVLFVESICDDQKIIEDSIREVKINSPDYVGVDKDEAVTDFVARIKHYEDYYEPIDEIRDKDWSFIKIFNQGEKFLVNRVKGNVLSRIVYYLMNIRVTKRTIYLTRHGESELNVLGRIGGDADLSPSGRAYAKKLADFIESENIGSLKVWTSHLKRTIQTAQHLRHFVRIEHWKALNEIDAGECEGMTYEEIQENFPVDFAKRDEDKFHYRYHMGESYQDLVARLEPVIMELERQSNVLVVTHQAVARCLIAYFLDKNKEELPYVKVPLHTVLKLTPSAYGCHVEYVDLNVPAVDTHRNRPEGVPSKILTHARDQLAHRHHVNPHQC